MFITKIDYSRQLIQKASDTATFSGSTYIYQKLIVGLDHIVGSAATNTVILGGSGNTATSVNTVILATTGVTGTVANMVYVPDLTIKNLASAAGLQTNSAGKVISTSDGRLKINVRSFNNALNIIQQLKPVKYEWIPSEHIHGTSMGVIAQDLIDILPEVVKGTPERLSVDYYGLVGLLIQGFKELNGDNQIKEISSNYDVTDDDNILIVSGTNINITLNKSFNNKKIKIKTFSDINILSDDCTIDNDFNLTKLSKSSCIELIYYNQSWIILSSDGSKSIIG